MGTHAGAGSAGAVLRAVADALRWLGEVSQEQEDFARAWALYRDSLALYQEEHATFEINVALIDIASLWMA
jgi:hypothetical protein